MALPRRELRILEHLVSHQGKWLTKTQLFNAIYGLFDSSFDENVIGHVSKLRKKTLEDLRGRRIVDMGFHLVAALVLHFAHQRMPKTTQVEIMTVLRNRGDAATPRRCRSRLSGAGDDIDPKRHAGDDEVLPGLPDHGQIAAERGEAADQAAYRDDEAEENTCALLRTGVTIV